MSADFFTAQDATNNAYAKKRIIKQDMDEGFVIGSGNEDGNRFVTSNEGSHNLNAFSNPERNNPKNIYTEQAIKSRVKKMAHQKPD